MHQSYSGSTGPESWGELGYPVCATGTQQSPIDIRTVSASTRAIDIMNIAVLDWQFGSSPSSSASAASPAVSLARAPPTLFLDLPVNSRFADVPPGPGDSGDADNDAGEFGGGGSGRRRLLNYLDGPLESYNGHAFTVEALGAPTLFIDGATYELREFHTHTPAEHAVDGARADMEIQFVHTLSRGGEAGGAGAPRYVVVSVLFGAGSAGAEPPFLSRLTSAISSEHFGSNPRWVPRCRRSRTRPVYRTARGFNGESAPSRPAMIGPVCFPR